MPPAEYVREGRAYLRGGQWKKAYTFLLQALACYPANPLIVSYCGWLQAVVDKKHQSGIAACRKAFVLFKTRDAHTAGIVYPILYLNLGRTYLAAGKKREAFEAFHNGLKHDPYHAELRKEMKRLGIRKKPLLLFLSRSNPINKYLGMLLHRNQPQLRCI